MVMAHSIKCKSCGHSIQYSSSSIGNTLNCPKCQNQVILQVPEDIENPKSYDFPRIINIQVVDQENRNLEIPDIAIILNRGVSIGPFFTDKQGKVVFKIEDYENAKSTDISTDLWGSKYRNWDQISTISVRILSEEEINKIIEARKEKWNILLSDEKRKWRSFDEFISALKNSNNNKIESVEQSIRLQNTQKDGTINLKLKTKLRGM